MSSAHLYTISNFVVNAYFMYTPTSPLQHPHRDETQLVRQSNKTPKKDCAPGAKPAAFKIMFGIRILAQQLGLKGSCNMICSDAPIHICTRQTCCTHILHVWYRYPAGCLDFNILLHNMLSTCTSCTCVMLSTTFISIHESNPRYGETPLRAK